jgi:hypothetical protein
MRYPILFFLLLASCLCSHAVDINPEKRVIPDKFVNPPGKRYSIFAGDPERVQKANEVNVKDFSGEVLIDPKSLSLSGQATEGTAPTQFKVTLKVKNNGKRSYTLSFPDSQRFDIIITTAEGSVLYVWSEDKSFVQKEGTSFVNAGESLNFSEFLPLENLKTKLTPGTYTLQMTLSNYPEITAKGILQVAP